MGLGVGRTIHARLPFAVPGHEPRHQPNATSNLPLAVHPSGTGSVPGPMQTTNDQLGSTQTNASVNGTLAPVYTPAHHLNTTTHSNDALEVQSSLQAPSLFYPTKASRPCEACAASHVQCTGGIPCQRCMKRDISCILWETAIPREPAQRSWHSG